MKFSMLVTFLALSLTFQKAQAVDVLVISDIDDTIKNTEVLNTEAAISNAFKTGKEMGISGMSNLYDLIGAQYGSIQFKYVSNAPSDVLDTTHQEFLSKNNFPEGGLYTNQHITDENHKVKTMVSQILINTPKIVILIGDNGERDVEVLDQITNTDFSKMTDGVYGKDIKFVQFIREAYRSKGDGKGKSLRNNQIGFITPAEIAIKLADENLLDVTTAVSVAKADHAKRNLELVNWVDCSDHTLLPELKNGRLIEALSKDNLLENLNKDIKTSCKIK